MMATLQQGLYPDIDACVAAWVTPHLGEAEPPDPDLSALYDRLYPVYRATREALAPVWRDLAAARRGR